MFCEARKAKAPRTVAVLPEPGTEKLAGACHGCKKERVAHLPVFEGAEHHAINGFGKGGEAVGVFGIATFDLISGAIVLFGELVHCVEAGLEFLGNIECGAECFGNIGEASDDALEVAIVGRYSPARACRAGLRPQRNGGSES